MGDITFNNLNSKRFVSPTKISLVFDEEKQKIYRYYPSEIRVVRFGDPYPAAYVKSHNHSYWKSYSPRSAFPFLFSKPSADLMNSKDANQKNFAEFKLSLYNKLISHIGEDVTHLLQRFPSRHWFLYCFLQKLDHYAYDLLNSNSALGYLISAHALFHPLKSKDYWRSARSLTFKKRKDILGYFGFPKNEAAVKLFARIDHKSFTNKLFFSLRKRLREDPALLRKLSFYSAHNEASLYILTSDLANIFHSSFIEQIARGKLDMNKHLLFHYVKEVKRMQELLSNQDLPQRKTLYKNSTDVVMLHNELMEKINSLQAKDSNHTFPLSPIPDIKTQTLHIETIKNSEMLYAEGKEMYHCIYSYNEKLKRGEYFAARMLRPERLTIYFRTELKQNRILEIRGKANSLPSDELLQIINCWLEGSITSEDPNQLTLFDLFS